MSAAAFEVLRFDAAPVTGDVVVVEIEGRWRGEADAGTRGARLVVEGEDGGRTELPAVVAEQDGTRWRASFAVPLDLRLRGRLHYALALRGVLLELPAPRPGTAGDRVVALARELNSARRRLEAAEAAVLAAREASEAAARAAHQTAETARREADAAVEEERRAARVAREEADARAAATVAAGDRAAEERAVAAERRAAEAQTTADAAARARDELHQRLTAERAVAAETQAAMERERDSARDDTRELRRTLKQTRAELEQLRRERSRAPGAVDLPAAARLRAGAPSAAGDGAADPSEDTTAVLARRTLGADELATRVGPSDDATAEQPAREPAVEDDGAVGEGIRVIGRERRLTLEDTVPSTTATLGEPPPLARYIALASLGVVLLVLLLVVVFGLLV